MVHLRWEECLEEVYIFLVNCKRVGGRGKKIGTYGFETMTPRSKC